MEQSKTAPVPDNEVEEVEKLHKQLITALGRPPGRRAPPRPPLLGHELDNVQDNFKARVTELLKTYADQPVPPGGDSQAAARKTGG